MAIAGLVIGIIAFLTSPLPFINNLSFVLALLGAVFSIVGIVACARGSRRGKGMAIASLIINIVAIALVLGSQSLYVAALDDAANGPDVSSVQDTDDQKSGKAAKDDAAGQKADGQADKDSAQVSLNLAVGTKVTLENGLDVTVDAVQAGLQNYDGSTVTGVHVTYANNGSEPASFNTFDWKGEDAQGTQRTTTYYSEAIEDLHSGTIAVGGTASSNIYFDGDLSKVLYYASVLTNDASASWSLK